jgi:hypothetical protein
MFVGILATASIVASQPLWTVIAAHPTHKVIASDHAWQMVAATETQVWFVDTRTKQRSQPNNVTYWTLTTYTANAVNKDNSNIKYELGSWTDNCNQKTIKLNSNSIFIGGTLSSSVGASRYLPLIPETIGETIWNAECLNRINFSSIAPASSISDAVALTDQFSRGLEKERVLKSGDLIDVVSIDEIADNFNKTKNSAGMIGVQSLIQDCYSAVGTMATLDNAQFLERCILLDDVAKQIDRSFSEEVSKITHGPPVSTPYWEDNIWLPRINKYLVLLQSFSPAVTTDKISSSADLVMKQLLKLLESG